HTAREPLALRALQPVDQLALVIGLSAFDRVAPPACVLAECPIDLGERDAAVDTGLTGPEQIQVRAVQDEHFHGGELSISARRAATRASRRAGAPSVS